MKRLKLVWITLKRLVIIVLLSFLSLNSFAQSDIKKFKAAEDSINYYLNKMSVHSTYFSGEYDTIWNKKLFNYLLNLCNTQPATLKEKFENLIAPEKLDIVTSDDKKFRIYSWDNMNGGTAHSFSSIIQYQAGNKVKAITLYDDATENPLIDTPEYFYSNLYTIKTNANKTVYLAVRKAMFSSKDVSMGIQAFTIDGNTVQDTIKFFQTKKECLNNFDCIYTFGYETKPVIHFSKDRKLLYVANIGYESAPTNWLIYKFDGYKFFYDHNEK